MGCRAKRAAKAPKADETRQIANLREQITRRITDVAVHSRAFGIELPDTRTSVAEADVFTGNEPLPADRLFATAQFHSLLDEDFDVDDEGMNLASAETAPRDRAPSEDRPNPHRPMGTAEQMLPEDVLIPLPSTVTVCSPELKSHELALRQRQAESLLKALREVIAEKSMQYSHTMRGAGRQIIKTRSRDRIAVLNTKRNDLTYAYGRCREAMILLGADEPVLSKFKVLAREDITSNTTVVNPNVPGSTTLHLSWIWHVGRDDQSAAAALHESASHPHDYVQRP